MQLPIHFTGLGHVNMYGLVDARGLAVVDPGMPGMRSWKVLVTALRRAGFRVRDVHAVVVTHSHPDHFGGARRLAWESGAGVVTHEAFSVPWLGAADADIAVSDDGDLASDDDAVGDSATVADHDDPNISGRTSVDPSGIQVPWRAPGDLLRPPELRHLPRPMQQLAWRAGRRFLQPPVPTTRLRDGAPIRLAGHDWFAVHTPGHTADHLCLYDPEQRVLLAGDHVLPTITPHVSGIDCGRDPLRRYLMALDRVARLDVGLVLPAHGQPFGDLAERVRQIANHHDQRLEQLLAVGASIGPATVEHFSHELFAPGQRGLLAQSEVFAHLEHLRLARLVRCARVDGTLVYALEHDG